MFTWICPQCGREVPPSASECPSCAEARSAAAQTPAIVPPAAPQPPQQHQPPQQQHYQPPPQQVYQAPPQQQQPPPPQQQYQPPPPQQSYVIAEPKKGLPTWLVGILVAAVIGGGLFGVYKVLSTGSSQNGKPAETALERPVPGETGAPGGIYAKFLEVVGFRLFEGADKKPRIRFTVVNHSSAPMSGLQLQVSLNRSGAEGEPPFAVVVAKVGDIEAHGAREIELPIKTTLRVYELPDWQFIRSTFTVTAPN